MRQRPLIFLLLMAGVASAAFSGCGPQYTYPADEVPESVERLAKKEYNIDATARVVGKTLGVVTYVDSMQGEDGGISKDVHEIMGKVMQCATRVALSTDRPIAFSTVRIRDRSRPVELVMTRSVEDTRRAHGEVIGIEESINRTLFTQSGYELSEVESNRFVLREIKLEDFLADQIVQRVRFQFAKELQGSKEQPLILVDGAFQVSDGLRRFQFSLIALKNSDASANVLKVFRLVTGVLKGYKFSDYDEVEIHDYMNRQKLVLDRATITAFLEERITEEEILERHLIMSQSIVDAFKLFGFTLPQDSNQEGVLSTATP